jgi:hypothetical protein
VSKRPPRILHETDRIRAGVDRRLAVGGFTILAAGAALFLWLRQGVTAATIAVIIIAAGAALLALLWLLLSVMEAWARED